MLTVRGEKSDRSTHLVVLLGKRAIASFSSRGTHTELLSNVEFNEPPRHSRTQRSEKERVIRLNATWYEIQKRSADITEGLEAPEVKFMNYPDLLR